MILVAYFIFYNIIIHFFIFDNVEYSKYLIDKVFLFINAIRQFVRVLTSRHHLIVVLLQIPYVLILVVYRR
jgi:hypothetical protein